MSLKEDIGKMSEYERYKLVVDLLRFFATAAAPFMIIGLGYYTKHYMGW